MRLKKWFFIANLFTVHLFAQEKEDSVNLKQAVYNPENIPIINLSESELEDNSATQNVSSILSSSRDVFQSNASFNLSQGGYRYRGYEGGNTNILVNGLSMNDPESGNAMWAEWGGLNDMFRGRQTIVGMANGSFTLGGIGGGIMFDSRAGRIFKGLNASYALTNQRFRNRISASYASGFIKGNWAFAGAFVRRWAEKGYEPGTYFDGYSYFFAVEKLFKNKHSLAFNTFGAPTRSARANVSTREMTELAGTNYYNPAWGFQNGQIRNANESNVFIPVFMLTYEYKPTTLTNVMLSAMYQFGKNKFSGLDWYNALNPAPDYYKNLPSLMEDSSAMRTAQDFLRNNEWARQIRWDDIYNTNRNASDSVRNANGGTETVYGNWSRYILSDRVEDSRQAQFNAIINHTINDNISIAGGLTYQYEKTNYYRQVSDLLGGDFFVNVNQFAERDYPNDSTANQFDIDNPNRILKVGDKYAYDYDMNIHKTQAWAQATLKFNKLDFFLGGQYSNSVFWRTGYNRIGLFEDNSLGDSKISVFHNYTVKAGISYKINGRNYIFFNGMAQSIAPGFRESFLSPITRNDLLPNLKSEKILSGEIGYFFNAPKIKAKATFFYTDFKDGIQNFMYFHDDFRTMVNYSLNNIGKRHFGAEIGADAEIYKGFGASAVANIARYQFSSRPTAYVTRNNDSEVLEDGTTIYMKDFNIGRTPQLATSFSLRYRSPQFWYVGMNFNYYDWMWVDVSPARRTSSALIGLEENSASWNEVTGQERLKGQFTMDFRAGYSMLMNKIFKFQAKQRYFLIINASVNNLTNNQNLVVSATEQLRFDYDDRNIRKFDTRYRYARGIGYFISINFRMQ